MLVDDIHDYKDDFDDQEAVEEQPHARPETALYQQKLSNLLTEDAKLLQQFEDVVKEIASYQLPQKTKDELTEYIVNNENASEKQIQDYVFRRIPYNKIGVLQYLKQYAKLAKQR